MKGSLIRAERIRGVSSSHKRNITSKIRIEQEARRIIKQVSESLYKSLLILVHFSSLNKMTGIRTLKQRRARYKGNVTKISTFLDSDEPKTANEDQLRLAKLAELWDKFEAVQNDLVEAKPNADEAELAALKAENEAEGQIFEAGYYRATAKLQEIIAEAAQEVA